jgi:hypothetical protein
MKERKEKRRWGLMAFIVVIMVGTSFSVVLFGFSSVSENVKYNGIKFTGDGAKWTAKINGNYAAFSFLPNEVEKIKAPEQLSDVLSGRIEIDSTSAANSTYREAIALAQHQMGLTLGAYGTFLRQGFEANNSYNFPIIGCSDATSGVPVVYFQESNLTEIEIINNCVIAKVSSEIDVIKIKDRLLYSMLGVI